MTHQEMEIKIKELEKRVKTLGQDPCEDEELDFVQPHKKINVSLVAYEDAISRQVVIDAIENEQKKIMRSDWAIDQSKFSAMSEIRELIVELPPVNTEKIRRWISVSERLPENNMACLVTVGKFTLTQTAMYSNLMGTLDHRIFYQGDYGHDNFADITQYVKAWMPLPEPYKAESEDVEGD